MDVEEILEAVHSLPPSKQLEVLQNLTRSLRNSWSPLAEDAVAFWSRQTVDELAAEQGVHVADNLVEFAMPNWPADESAEDLNTFVRAQRDADRGV